MSRTERRPVRRPYRSPCGLSEQSCVAEVIRQTDRDTRTAGDKSMSRHRFADLPEIIIDDSVHYDEPSTCRGFSFERSADRG